MGTRGAFGFRVDGQDKVTYNHFDSYPTGLGGQLLRDLHGQSIDSLRDIARNIILVNNKREKPTPKQMAQLSKYANLNVSDKTLDDWYCLLRQAQGSLKAWIVERCPVMIDSHTFLLDSLFCEWAYIVNLNEGVFEVYKGFQEQPGEGRYGRLKEKEPGHRPSKYYGVALIDSIPLADGFSFSDEQRKAYIKRWEDVEEEKEEAGAANGI